MNINLRKVKTTTELEQILEREGIEADTRPGDNGTTDVLILPTKRQGVKILMHRYNSDWYIDILIDGALETTIPVYTLRIDPGKEAELYGDCCTIWLTQGDG
jgi:hypothetical protein